MSVIRLNPEWSNLALREALFAGDIVLFTAVPAVAELVAHTRRELGALFSPHDPQQVHEHIEPAELARILTEWKPRFMRTETALRLTRQIATQIGFDPATTHFDLPKPRTVYPVGHLTTGIASGFPWHRDTWYAACRQQINLWLPIWEPRADNSMAFDPSGFGRAVPNDSAGFDYYRRNVERGSLATVVKSDPRAQPGAIDWHPERPTIVLPSPGSVLVFSGDQLHRTIPNTSGLSRYSIDFRIVETTDIEADRGAPCVDSRCTGTAIRDFKRIQDGADMPERIVRLVEPVPPPEGTELTFKPRGATESAPG